MQIVCACEDRSCDCYLRSGHGQAGIVQITMIVPYDMTPNDIIRYIEHLECEGNTPTSTYEAAGLFVHIDDPTHLPHNPGVVIHLPKKARIGAHDELILYGYDTLSEFLDAQFTAPDHA
jgi:hypothetical protein